MWPDKNRQTSIKVAQKWFHYKNEWFWNLYKNCLTMWAIWVNKCCHRLWMVAQSAKNCPFWSHCLLLKIKFYSQAISTVAFLELDMPLDDQASHRQLNWPKNSSTWFRLISMVSCFTDSIWKIMSVQDQFRNHLNKMGILIIGRDLLLDWRPLVTPEQPLGWDI